jgi:hypothetical protein
VDQGRKLDDRANLRNADRDDRLQANGKLTRRDYREVLEPALRKAAEAGRIRMLFELDTFEGLEHRAWFDDIKTGVAA